MEIRQVLRGNDTSFGISASNVKARNSKTAAALPSADRTELSRRWVEQMQEQSARIQALLTQPSNQEETDEGGLLGYMETEEDQLDALSEQLDVQMKCMKIAANIMKGKKVPPQDERYLMENDPEGYKLAIAMKVLVKEDKKECKSVLTDEDKKNGETSETEETGEPAPTESTSGDGEAIE